MRTHENQPNNPTKRPSVVSFIKFPVLCSSLRLVVVTTHSDVSLGLLVVLLVISTSFLVGRCGHSFWQSFGRCAWGIVV